MALEAYLARGIWKRLNQIMVVYWSQTGSTEAMANAVAEGIKEAGKDALVTEVSNISADALKDAGVFAL